MSGRKDVLPPFKIVNGGDLSANRISSITNIQYMDNIGIQVNLLTGSATGTFDVTISADHTAVIGGGIPVVLVPGNFIPLGGIYRATVTASSPTNIYFDITEISASYIQLLWTFGSGSGTFDAFIIGKML